MNVHSVLIIWYIQFRLKVCNKISVLMQRAIRYVQMERYVHAPGFKGDTLIHCRHRHLNERYVLLFRCDNFSHPDMHGTLSRHDCTVATTSMCLAMDFITARTSHEFK